MGKTTPKVIQERAVRIHENLAYAWIDSVSAASVALNVRSTFFSINRSQAPGLALM
jgi:hypothetical protein